MKRTILRAAPGMVLTDGVTYGREILLAMDAEASAFREITEAEFEARMAQEKAHEV